MQLAELPRERLEEARALLAEACAFDRAGLVAEEKLFGAAPGHQTVAIGAFTGETLVGVATVSGRWLRLLAVAPGARRLGVGVALLDACRARARGFGATRLRTGDQAGNYLAPGVDVRNVETLAWLGKRGFVEVAAYENLDVPLAGNPLVTKERAAELAAVAAGLGYDVRRAEPADVARLVTFAREAFANAWAFEVARALENDPAGVHIAVVAATGEPIAFACHDGNNRGLGWFGPAGTAVAHRGKGLGQALLIPCLLDVAAAGVDPGVIAWIGPKKFYAAAAGAVDGRKFVVLQCEL